MGNAPYAINEYVPYTNVLLQNILFTWHPPLLYFFLLYTIFLYIHSYIKRYPRYVFFVIATNVKACGPLVATALLSMWWALQEGTWGGWWGWDMSEYLLVLWGGVLFFFIHCARIYIFWYSYYFFFLLYLIYIYGRAQFFLQKTAHTFLTWGTLLHTYHFLYPVAHFFLLTVLLNILRRGNYTLFYLYGGVRSYFIYFTGVGFYVLMLFIIPWPIILFHHTLYLFVLIMRNRPYSIYFYQWPALHAAFLYIYLYEQLFNNPLYLTSLVPYTHLNMVGNGITFYSFSLIFFFL